MKIPVTVIGGYLGAGKTTLINHMLRSANGLRLAILVNEFGDLAIDQDLIEAQDDGVMAISGGCVCCAYGNDMIGALEDMRDATPAFDHILIEASGVALPASIMTTVGMVYGLRPDATIVLADVEQIRKNARHKFLHDTILAQLEQADLLLLTKTDLVDASVVEDVKDWLSTVAPIARCLPIANGEIALEALIGTIPFAQRRPMENVTHKSVFDSIVITPDHNIDPQALGEAFAKDPTITRAKGFVQTATGTALIHVVGSRYSFDLLDDHHSLGVVCIGIKGEFDPSNAEKHMRHAERTDA